MYMLYARAVLKTGNILNMDIGQKIIKKQYKNIYVGNYKLMLIILTTTECCE